MKTHRLITSGFVRSRIISTASAASSRHRLTGMIGLNLYRMVYPASWAFRAAATRSGSVPATGSNASDCVRPATLQTMIVLPLCRRSLIHSTFALLVWITRYLPSSRPKNSMISPRQPSSGSRHSTSASSSSRNVSCQGFCSISRANCST